MVPHGVSRSMSHWSRGTHSSGVRFWNFTASQPASAATWIRARASSSSPLWLMPISATTYAGWPGPTTRSPKRRNRVGSTVEMSGTTAVMVELLSEQPRGDLTDRPSAALGGGHRAGSCPYGAVRVGDRDWPTDEVEAGKVVDVVADVEHAGRVEALLGAPPRERGALGVDPVQAGDAELVRAGPHDGVLLGREDEQAVARPTERGGAEPVASVDRDRLVAARVDPGPVVGERP